MRKCFNLIIIVSSLLVAEAFQVLNLQHDYGRKTRLVRQSNVQTQNNVEIYSDESKGKLTPEEEECNKLALLMFELRDLQIIDVPLLECDADKPPTMLAAMWTTMAEFSEGKEAASACLVLQSIPNKDLRAFVEDFNSLKCDHGLIDHLPEIQRFNVSFVSNETGLAVLVEAGKRREKQRNVFRKNPLKPDSDKWREAMKNFMTRVFTKNKSDYKDIPLTQFRQVASTDVCTTMAVFWNAMCELMLSPIDKPSTIVLCLPPPSLGLENATEVHSRFSAISKLISRSLQLYHIDEQVDISYFHPLYDRDMIAPAEKPLHGHLPPRSWWRPLINAGGEVVEEVGITDEQLTLFNYQRRSPLPAIVISRASQENEAKRTVPIETVDGRIEVPRHLVDKSLETLTLAGKGEDSLRESLDAEIALLV